MLFSFHKPFENKKKNILSRSCSCIPGPGFTDWIFPNLMDTGLYGNDDLHNGLLEVLTAGRKVDNIISSVRNQTQILESTLANKIKPQLVELADIFDQPASNQTALSQLILSLSNVQGNVTNAKNAAADIRRPLMQVTITSFLSVSCQMSINFRC